MTEKGPKDPYFDDFGHDFAEIRSRAYDME
jgi:hypothetical protein